MLEEDSFLWSMHVKYIFNKRDSFPHTCSQKEADTAKRNTQLVEWVTKKESRQLNLNIYTTRKLKFRQSVYCFGRGRVNFDQALMGAQFELLPRFLVDVR